ncbi:alpha/beta hydrolase [Pleurocapsales cyanobacterium LEGE 10410]|nr:alpha/beta hydrolase [Pleurocapsales cyanobacterium LEGE 10410]
MFPDFLPQDFNLLEHSDSILLAKNIKRDPILTPLSSRAIATADVKSGTTEPAILLLHGFDSSLLEFRRLIPLLASECQTWAVDLLGFGFTERLPHLSYNPQTIREHLYAFWQSKIARPVILVGTSMGGATAIDFTTTYPKAVQKLVLINSVGYSGSFPVGKLLFEPLDWLAVEFWRQRRIQSLYWGKNFGLLDSQTEDILRCATLPSHMPNWELAINQFTRSGGYYQLSERIHLVDRSTLILWGECDDLLGTEAAHRFNRAIANAELVWLPGVGHAPQWEQPTTVVRHIVRFINS